MLLKTILHFFSIHNIKTALCSQTHTLEEWNHKVKVHDYIYYCKGILHSHIRDAWPTGSSNDHVSQLLDTITST